MEIFVYLLKRLTVYLYSAQIKIVICFALPVVICSALLVFYFVKHFSCGFSSAPARHSSNKFGSALAYSQNL